MKKFLIFSAMLGSMVFAVSSAEAKTASSPAAASTHLSVNLAQPRRWGYRPIRTVTRTRITRVGRFRYRETIRTTYYRNGRVRTRVISRVRLGRRW
jgi:hypothetical protein